MDIVVLFRYIHSHRLLPAKCPYKCIILIKQLEALGFSFIRVSSSLFKLIPAYSSVLFFLLFFPMNCASSLHRSAPSALPVYSTSSAFAVALAGALKDPRKVQTQLKLQSTVSKSRWNSFYSCRPSSPFLCRSAPEHLKHRKNWHNI